MKALLPSPALILLLVTFNVVNASTFSTEATNASSPFQVVSGAADATTSWHINTTTAYSKNGRLTIPYPTSNEYDQDDDLLLVLFLSRTDSFLPMEIYGGWTRLASCYKTYNEQPQCFTAEDCLKEANRMGKTFCYSFPVGKGRDLGTVVFAKKVGRKEVTRTTKKITMGGWPPSWAIMTLLRGVNTTDPVRSVATASCDNSVHSLFPSVDALQDDVLLLSMAYDDAAPQSAFTAPSTTTVLGYTRGYDETGILYGKRIGSNGPTGSLMTGGDGSYHCKDALITLALRHN